MKKDYVMEKSILRKFTLTSMVLLGFSTISYANDLKINLHNVPHTVKAGQKLNNIQTTVSNTFGTTHQVAVDFVMTDRPSYPTPAPFASYSANYKNGVLLKGGREHPTLLSRSSKKLTLHGEIPKNITPGTYYLAAVIDAGNKINESNENNNVSFKKVIVKAERKLPNLIIKDIYLDQKCQVVVKVKNIGQGSIPTQVWTQHTPKSAGVYLHINGQKWGGSTIWKFDSAKKLLRPGGEAIYKSKLKVTQNAKIKATVDLWNKIAESRESDNVKVKRVQCKVASSTLREDCVSFNPNTTKIIHQNNKWKIADGNHLMFSFSSQSEAKQALKIIKSYKLNKSCFVGRPDPSFQYLLKNNHAPVGHLSGEDCVTFNPSNIQVKKINNRYKIVEGNHWIFDFGQKRDEAHKAYNIIKRYQAKKSCFVGRPNVSFQYLRK
jgi:hypothetical protein